MQQTLDKKVKVRDLAPTAVRLAPEIRASLMREAAINGRTLHAEIVLRLSRSLQPATPGVHAHGKPGPADPVTALTDGDRALLTVFRKLSPEKQLALLSLLK